MKKAPQGRPTKYTPEHDDQARKLCLLGATDIEIASILGISTGTLDAWKKAHPSFLSSLKAGKEAADSNVADRLYKRAMGYTHDAVKIFANPTTGAEQIVPFTEHYPPDTTACIFWLKNRQRARWRDRQEIDQTITNLSDAIKELDGQS